MMSKKQWFALLCLSILYLLLGACFFYQVETREETKRKAQERIERKEIEELLRIHYIPSIDATQHEIFEKLSTYCGKPMHYNMSKTDEVRTWDFYHSLFFVITVFTTVGYGNLAPTTMPGRIFMIFYALIGVPMNGILMVTLAEFFGKKFTKLYNRWKTKKLNHLTAHLGLISQITLYLIPGVIFFIFIPAVIIMYFEGWDYDVAVYYAFVTLTTIGFGDYVAGVNRAIDNDLDIILFSIYQIFLLVWIIIGLGYGLMVIGFISRGMKSKKMHAIEHMLANNLKRTPDRFRELRSLVHEIILIRMGIKPVYKKQSFSTPIYQTQRSRSLPNLNIIYGSSSSPAAARKRAQSETIFGKDLPRIQSDTDLHLIDKDLTFNTTPQQTELVLKVLDDLDCLSTRGSCQGIDGFSDCDILKTERHPSQWTIGSKIDQVFPTIPYNVRKRAFSESVQFEEELNTVTWYGQTAALKQQEIRERIKHGRARSRTLPVQQQPLIKIPPTNFLSKLKKTFGSKNNCKGDIESQEFYIPKPPKRHRAFSECPNTQAPACSSSHDEFELEKMIELLRLAFLPDNQPKRKLGTASLTPPYEYSPRPRRQAIRPPFQSRRSSVIPTVNANRRYSLRPVDDILLPPPTYNPIEPRPKRFSIRPVVTNLTNTPSPIQRQRMKTNKDVIKE